MFVSLLASATGVLAGLLFLASFLMSGAFAGDVPSGSNAAGLVVPLFCSIGAGLLLLIAVWSLLGSGRLAWVGAHAGMVATVVTFGVGVSAVGTLLAWMERTGAWVTPLGWFCGALAPLLGVVLVLRCAWQAPEQLQAAHWPRLLAAPLLLAALCGLGLALWGATLLFRQDQNQRERAVAAQTADDIESARRQALTPVQRLAEDYAKMSPSTPLWVFVAGLPDTADPAQRQFIVARAMQVPDFELDLERTVTDGHPVYRHGAIDLMREAPAAAKKPLWSSWLARAIALSAEQIATDPKWLQPDTSSNPQPIGHLRAMIDASQRLGHSEEVDAAIQKLRASLEGLPDGSTRSQALDAIGH